MVCTVHVCVWSVFDMCLWYKLYPCNSIISFLRDHLCLRHMRFVCVYRVFCNVYFTRAKKVVPSLSTIEGPLKDIKMEIHVRRCGFVCVRGTTIGSIDLVWWHLCNALSLFFSLFIIPFFWNMCFCGDFFVWSSSLQWRQKRKIRRRTIFHLKPLNRTDAIRVQHTFYDFMKTGIV